MDHRHQIASALIAIAVLAAAIRLPRLGNQPLWTDEANGLAIAQVRSVSVWQALEHDCSPPLYYWLMRLVVGRGHPGEARVRALSAAFGVLAPPVLGYVGVRMVGVSGLLAGLLLALSPLHVWHSQEARMYSLVCLLGVLLTWLTVVVARGERRWFPMLALTQIALLWTHHFSVFVVAISWMLVAAGGTHTLRRTVTQGVAVILGWLPAAWLLARQVFVFRTGTWLPAPTFDAPVRTVGLWLAGVEPTGHSTVAGIPVALVLAVAGAAPLAVGGLRLATGRLLGFFCGGTLLLAWGVSRAVPALVPGRYDVVLLPSLLLLLAVGWKESTRPVRAASLMAMMAAASLSLGHYCWRYHKGAMRDLAALIADTERNGDTIVVVPETEAPVLRYYYRGQAPILVPPDFGLVDRVDYAHYGNRWANAGAAQELAADCWERTPRGGRIHLLYSPYRTTVQFKGWLMAGASSYTRIARSVTASGSTELAVLERQDGSAARSTRTSHTVGSDATTP